MRLTLKLILSLLIANPTIAKSQITFGGESYPSGVNLQNQFEPETALQVGGTCHIFAAAALFEAACFRSTHKHVKVSEAYLINRHLSTELARSNYLPDEIESNSILGDMDGGHAKTDISRIFNGSICTGKEMPLDSQFFNSLKQIASAIEGQAPNLACQVRSKYARQEKELESALAESQKQSSVAQSKFEKSQAAARQSLARSFLNLGTYGFPVDLGMYLTIRDIVKEDKMKAVATQSAAEQKKLSLERLGNSINNEIRDANETLLQAAKNEVSKVLNDQIKKASKDAEVAASGGYSLKTKDKDLKKCFDTPMRAKEYQFSTKNALDLLSKGIPFICNGNFTFPNGAKGRHSTTVVGYEYDDANESHLSYLLRDSNYKTVKGGWDLHCDNIVVIY